MKLDTRGYEYELVDGLDRPTHWRARVAAAPQFHQNHVLTTFTAQRRVRRWLSALLLVALPTGACTPASTQPAAPPAPSAPALAKTAELAGALDGASDVARGKAVTDSGGVVLSLGDATLVHLRDAGSPCTLDEGAKVLVMFEGPEAFALVGDRAPRIVARERDSGHLQCWPISAPARVVPTDITDSTPQLEVALARAEEHATARQRTTAELRPELDGDETIALELLDAALHLRVTSHAGVLLLDWEAGELCELSELGVVALRREAGVVFVLDQRCDACPTCDHGENVLDTTDEIWWPDGGSAFLVERGSLHSTAAGSMDSGQRSVESHTCESWPLTEGILRHDLVEIETTHTSFECADEEQDTEDCCVRQSVDTARSASWTYEPSSGAPLTWVVDQTSTTSEGECE
jgi:hypothetical protein